MDFIFMGIRLFPKRKLVAKQHFVETFINDMVNSVHPLMVCLFVFNKTLIYNFL